MKNSSSGLLTILDKGTGEFQDYVPLNSEYNIVHKNSAASYKEHRRIEELKLNGRGRTWVACYHDPIKNIAKEMSLIEAGALLKLLPYLRFKTEGKITRDGEAMQLKEIQQVLGKGKTQTRNILNGLEKLKVVFKEKDGRQNSYFISKTFHTMGEVLEGMRFTKLYQKRTKEMLDKLKMNEAGILYKMLPFFHYSEYCLCSNPDEEDVTKLDMLTREELAELIGHEPETVSRYINTLMNQNIILKMVSSKSVNYYVHPDVMFRKQAEDEKTEKIRDMFNEFFCRLNRSKKIEE
jgi:hypothetical protein